MKISKKILEKNLSLMHELLKPNGNQYDAFIQMHKLMVIFLQYIEERYGQANSQDNKENESG